MNVYRLDPLTDPRWNDFVEHHPQASVFHTIGWLGALQRTYGFRPTVFSTCAPVEALTNGVVFCEVRSWITGNRLVSLPFSDHCDPLVSNVEQFNAIVRFLQTERHMQGWRRIELRPRRTLTEADCGLSASSSYWLHTLNTSPDLETIFRGFHKDSVRRKLHRARRENLTYEEGLDEAQLKAFYQLQLLTRRRHGLPPQPYEWFSNLAASLGSGMKVRLVHKAGRPIAGMVTLSHRGTMVYKYGASDAAYHAAGGMHLLFWAAIQDARETGCFELDLGRSDLAHDGLIVFKDRWGATRFPINYWRYPANGRAVRWLACFTNTGAAKILGHVPAAIGIAAGRLLHKHVG